MAGENAAPLFANTFANNLEHHVIATRPITSRRGSKTFNQLRRVVTRWYMVGPGSETCRVS